MGFFSKDIKTLDDLFVHTLRDIYYAEKQIETALPKMIDKATSAPLKAGFEKHLQETHGHVDRLEEVFELLRRQGERHQLPGDRRHHRGDRGNRRRHRRPAGAWTPR